MSEAIKINKSELPSLSGLRQIKRRFMALNTERLKLVRNALKDHQRLFVELLPLLFHVNHPALPGYVSDNTPIGVADYKPGKRCLSEVRTLSREFKYKRRAMRLYNIESMYLMGSTGTVAYSRKSDFDIWICHNPDLSQEQLDELHQRCDLITKWATQLGLETNFFLLTAESLRRGRIESLSEESSGTAQYMLLKEEFYRTAVLLAGRYPVWWLVPPDREYDYYKYVQMLFEHDLVYEYEVMDFGDLAFIPAGEFFGATLWHLNKAIHSPYKSVLKLLLMEAYACEYPHTDMLATRFKKAVYGGETQIDKMDPYVLIMEKVDEFLTNENQPARLNLARRCFYFKVHEKMSVRRKRNITRRYEVMDELVKLWGWERDYLLVLDSRDTWKIHRVMEEAKLITAELMRSYHSLSEFARKHSEQPDIMQSDLNLLGRKLYVAFERKAGKVDLINPGISVDLSEERLSFIQTETDGISSWALYRADAAEALSGKLQPIKRKHHLIELLVWCHFNQLVSHQSLLTIHRNEQTESNREAHAILDALARLFPDGAAGEVLMQDVSQTPTIQTAMLYINEGLDPLENYTRQGIHLTSNRADSLCYGGFWKNLAINCDLVLLNSWGEVLTFHYHGKTAVLDCLSDYLAWTPVSSRQFPGKLHVRSFSTARGTSIAARVQELYNSLYHVFYKKASSNNPRYAMRLGYDYYLAQTENDVPRFQRVGTETHLLNTLGIAQEAYSNIVFDSYTFKDFPIGPLFRYNQPDTIQVLYQLHHPDVRIYIFDEKGSLFYQDLPFHNEDSLMNQLQRFLTSSLNRRTARLNQPENAMLSDEIEFLNIRTNYDGKLVAEHKLPPDSGYQGQYMGIQVIADHLNEKNQDITLYCDNREFSYMEFGEKLYTEVVRYVLAKRTPGVRYPVYITDMDLTPAVMQQDNSGMQTVHYLNYKKLIEKRLNMAMGAL